MYDLHTHSHYSDGMDSPEQLIDHIKKLGLQGLSITDHDTIGAYPQAIDYATSQGLDMILGVEFSCALDSIPVHILAYSCAGEALEPLIQRHKKRREIRNEQIIANLNKLGYAITLEEVAQNFSTNSLGRPHIGHMLVQKGFCHSLSHAFHTLLGDHKKAYAFVPPPSIQETLETIHNARGFSILAHPHLLPNLSVFDQLLHFPFHGIEGNYASMTRRQSAYYVEKAKKKDLLITGGSDYHGLNRPHNRLGASTTSPKVFDILKQGT